MRILVVAHFIPMPDRQAGMLRFFRLLSILAERHDVRFFATDIQQQYTQFGEIAVTGYRKNLLEIGIDVTHGASVDLNKVFRREQFDIVFFEHYKFALPYVEEIRLWQSRAKIVIDSIDVNYQRLMSKAMVRQKREDFDEAAKVKIAELSAYGSSDVVIAISDQDKALLTRDDRKLNVDVIPLIFPVPALQPRRERSSCNLLFVGNFEHAANVDAVSFFCDSAFPALRRRLPSVKLTIIGNSPNAAIKNRASSDIQVLGFVPELSPYYESSDISVAPLTWGGGLKGKIAEAMSFGLPVVATTVGIDGFRLTPGENVVVADTVDEIVEGIIKLHQDRQFYERIRTKAWQFVEQNYGDRAVREQLEGVIARLENCKAKEMPAWKKLKRKVPIFLDTHLLWRFRR